MGWFWFRIRILRQKLPWKWCFVFQQQIQTHYLQTCVIGASYRIMHKDARFTIRLLRATPNHPPIINRRNSVLGAHSDCNIETTFWLWYYSTPIVIKIFARQSYWILRSEQSYLKLSVPSDNQRKQSVSGLITPGFQLIRNYYHEGLNWLNSTQREISRGYINQKNLVELNMVTSTTKHSLGDKRSHNNNLKTGCNNQIQYDFLFLVTVTTRRN